MAIPTLRVRRIDGRSDLDGAGIVKKYADFLVTRLNLIIAVLNLMTDFTAGGRIIKFNTAGDTNITWNETDKQFEFYIDGSLEGVLDASGFSTEPT